MMHHTSETDAPTITIGFLRTMLRAPVRVSENIWMLLMCWRRNLVLNQCKASTISSSHNIVTSQDEGLTSLIFSEYQSAAGVQKWGEYRNVCINTGKKT